MQFHMRIQTPTADHIMDSLILSHSIVLSNASLEIGRNCAPGRSLQGRIICVHGHNMPFRVDFVQSNYLILLQVQLSCGQIDVPCNLSLNDECFSHRMLVR
jgi:hypothetical protein